MFQPASISSLLIHLTFSRYVVPVVLCDVRPPGQSVKLVCIERASDPVHDEGFLLILIPLLFKQVVCIRSIEAHGPVRTSQFGQDPPPAVDRPSRWVQHLLHNDV